MTVKPSRTLHAPRSVFARLRAPKSIAVALTIAIAGCAGPSRAAGDQPKSSTEGAHQPEVRPTDPAADTDSAAQSSARPVGTKLVRDVDASPKQFKIGPNNGQGLGDFSLAVDGREVWPPKGNGCQALVRCCTDLVGLNKQLAMACLLATGRDGDCITARRTSSDIALEHGLTLPSSCAQ
jgi:hypothetical protein